MGGSSKKQTVGYKYYIGAQLVLCHGPIDSVLEIIIDKKLAWEGSVADGQLQIDANDLFGGEQREGGISGLVDIEMGASDQLPNDYLQSQLGTDIPSFRGVVSAILRQVYMGNNPYFKTWAFLAQRIYTTSDGAPQWLPEYAAINGDTTAEEVVGDVIVNYDDDFKYIVEDDYTSADYSAVDYDDSSWAVSQGTFGSYGGDNTFVPTGLPGRGIWIRHTFTVPGLATNVKINTVNDDGVQIWVNGVEEFSLGYGANPKVTLLPGDLLPGVNQIACLAVDTVPAGSATNIRLGLEIEWDGIKSQQIDMNPAHIIRECLTDTQWGMGYPTSEIDDVSFSAAAETLFDEGMGISMLWDKQSTIMEFVNGIIQHIDASLYVDRNDGLFHLDLIRDDYVLAALPTFDESNIIRAEAPSRKTYGELVNSVTVVFWDAQTRENASVNVQNSALITQQNAVIDTTVQYLGFTNATIATRVALRDLRSLSTPLWSAVFYTNKDAEDLKVGSVFKWDWLELGLTEIVMRVSDIAYGDGKSKQVKITATQSAFSLPDQGGVGTPLPEDGWQPINTEMVPADVRVVGEAPYYNLVVDQGQSAADGILLNNPDAGYLYAASGRPPVEGAINANLYADSGLGYEEGDIVDFSPYGQLTIAVGKNETSTIAIENGEDLDEIELGTFAQIGTEYWRVDAVNILTATTAEIDVGRAVMDTLPEDHVQGAAIVFIGNDKASDDVEYVASEIVSVKMTPASGASVLDINDAPVDLLTFNRRANAPYPPGNLTINGEYFPDSIGYVTLELAWAHRDRTQQTSALLEDFLDANIGPETNVTYTVNIYDENDALGKTSTGITGTEFSYTNEEELSDMPQFGESGDIPEFDGDEYFGNVQLLLHCDGTDGSVVFTDSSANNHTMGVVGASQIDTAIFKFGGASCLFNGATDYLTTPAAMTVSTLDFTVEAWVYRNANATEQCLFDFWGNAGTGFLVYIDSAANPGKLSYSNAATVPGISTTTIPLTTWTHVAVTRDSGIVRGFINGVLEFTFVDTRDIDASQMVGIGNAQGYAQYVNGQIDDVRFTIGACRYTEGFAVPDSAFDDVGINYELPDTFYGNVQLLLSYDSTDALQTFTDYSGETRGVQTFGDAQADSGNVKFGTAALTCDGTGDYLRIPDDPAFDDMTSPFTIECWVYVPTSHKTTSRILGKRQVAGNFVGWGFVLNNSGQLRMSAGNNGGIYFELAAASPIPVDQWVHVAGTFDGTTYRIFEDGVEVDSTTSTSGTYVAANEDLLIGRDPVNTTRDFKGNMDDLRITMGVARYTAGFTPPGQLVQLSTIVKFDPYYNEAGILLHFDGVTNATETSDSSAYIANVTLNGDAQLETGSAFGLTALLLDGTGDYAQVTNIGELDLGIHEFTFECWVNCSATGQRCLVDTRDSGNVGFALHVSTTTDANKLSYSDNSVVIATSTNTIPLDTWTHIAINRFDGVVYGYIDGVQEFAIADARVFDSGSDIFIGTTAALSDDYLGLIDELRVTRYISRYGDVSSFVAPSASFADRGPFKGDVYYDNVELLLDFGGPNTATSVTDKSGKTRPVTFNGDAQLNSSTFKFETASLGLDGTGDYLTVPHDAVLNNLTSPFTIELWVYVPGSHKATACLIDKRDGGTTFNGWLFHLSPSGALAFYMRNTGGAAYISFNSASAIPLDQWVHLAVSFDGTTYRTFINGAVANSSSTPTGTYQSSSTDLRIGRDLASAARDFNGWMDDIRITMGACRYSADFTPGNEPNPVITMDKIDPFYNDTEVLLRFDGNDGDTTTDDRSKNANTVTFTGNVELDGQSSMFGPASAVFDGVGDALSVTPISTIEDDDFTVEFWVNPNASPGEALCKLVNIGADDTVGGLYISRQASTNPMNIRVYLVNTGPIYPAVFSENSGNSYETITPDVWTHIALTRQNGDWRLFINGNLDLEELSNVATGTTLSENIVYIGNGSALDESFAGNIDNVRVTKGVARYVAAFDPPIRPYPAINEAYNNTPSFVTRANGLNGQNDFYDVTGKAISVNGDAAIDSANRYYEYGAAIVFDGTGDYLSTPDHADFNMGSGDFTIQCHVNVDLSQDSSPFGKRPVGASGWAVTVRSTGRLDFRAEVGGVYSGTFMTSAVGAITADTWHHIAITRFGDDWFMFIDGTLAASNNNSGVLDNVANALTIGSSASTGEALMLGYLDDPSIYKGVALYTENFTPPEAPLPITGVDESALNVRLNYKLRFTLASVRADGPVNVQSYNEYNITLYRPGYGLNYGFAYGDV